jgi:hypothetical protein
VITIRIGSVALAAAQPAKITPITPVALSGSALIPIPMEKPMIVRIESVKYVTMAIRPYSANSSDSRWRSGGRGRGGS